MSKPSDLRIAIIGGGVCGITCAVALTKKGINAHIYEAKGKYGEIGAGIGIGASSLQIMRELGIYDDLLACTPNPGECNIQGFRFVFGSEGHEEIFKMPARPDEYAVGIHRVTFLDILVKHLDPQYTHFNKRCVDVTVAEKFPSSSTAIFDDGSTIEADVVLLANGIKCPLRHIITGSKSNAAFGNNVCYRGLVAREETKKRGIETTYWDEPTIAIGNNRSLVIYPINGGAVLNIAAFVTRYGYAIGHPDVARDDSAPTLEVVSNEELLEKFKDYDSNLLSILGCLAKPNKWYINVVYPHLDSFVKGRVALLGDAAHAMVPHLYAGAGQGIEDGYLLAQLLSHPQTTSENVEVVLEAYDAVRRPRSQKVWDDSYAAGKAQAGMGPSGFTKDGIINDVTGIMDFVNSYKLGDELMQVEVMLKERSVWV
ncbi:hypothetical protein PHLGIDRAFT_91141, partial [Phlebiopsis gigantea 11061_1 CR5-6]